MNDPKSSNYLITKEMLDQLDKYDGDFGLLDERWVNKKDREKFSGKQMKTLGEYLDKLFGAQVKMLSPDLRESLLERINELESVIDPEVIDVLRKRAGLESLP